MSILRSLTVACTALALTLLGLVFPTMAVAQERAAFPGAIDLPTWIMDGREPIKSDASPQDNWVVTGKVVTYLSGERAGATDDNGEEIVAGIHVFARYQANNGAWSPIFKATTTSLETKSKTGRLSNYAIKMRDFVDYNGELGQFRPGEGKAQRLQVWINPKQVPGYRLTFSERTGGVIQGYSTRKDFNWTASQMMQWGFLSVGTNSTQVSQVNIGLIKVANSEAELNLGPGVKIEHSLASPPATGLAAKKKTLQGYVRWENQTLNRGGGNAYVGRANIADYPVNTPAEGYVVVAAVKNQKDNSVEARCTTTKNLSNDNGKTPNWTIYFDNDVDVKHMKFQVFKGTCEKNNVSLQPLPKRMAYWSPFPTAVDSWGTTLNGLPGNANQGWTGTRWEDNVRVLLRPLQMQLLPHGESLGSSAGTQSFYGDKVKVDYSRLPLNTPLVAHLYTGTLSDNGSGEPIESKTFTAQDSQGSGSVTFDTELTGDTFQEYWVDVVPENVTENPEWQVLASQSFLYKPIQLEISKGAANTPGTFTITKKAPADNLVKLTGCEAVSNTDTAAATDALPYDLKRDSTGDGCKLTGTPEKSGVHSLWVKFTFTDKDGKSHTSVQYLPWTVEPRLKPQIEPGTSDSELSKYSPLEKFPAVGVPYSGLVSPFPDWQGRHFTYQVFDTDPGSGGTALMPDTNGMVSLGDSGLKFNTMTGQVTGTTQADKSAVFWVKATDEDGEVTPAMKYEIYPGSPLILQRAQLPTGSGGSVYQNANGTPIVIWVSGGEPSANELTVSGTTLPRNTYANTEILGVYDGDNNEVQAGNIGGVKCESQNNSGGGKFILCSGTPNVSKATTYYLQVKYTDTNGRTLNGAKYTLPQVKALTTLTGSEGWLKMTLLPKIAADTDTDPNVISTKLPDGTKGLSYGPQNVKSYLSGGTGNFANYTFSAAGLPAGLTMSADGVITGKPLETTTPGGVSVKVYLRGKDGTAAERSSTSVTFQLRINTDLKATTDTLSATAQGGTTYTSSNPLLDVSSAAGITGGVSPYSYKLQYRDSANASWQDAATSGGRYQVPNADATHSASGLLLDSNGKLVGATMGKDSFPQLRVVVTDADMVSCTGGCSINVGLDLTRTDKRRPSVATDASITANVGETVTGFLPVNDPSGKPQKYEIDTKDLPKGVTLTVGSDGKYTLTATHQAVAGNSGSVTLKVTGANGMVGTVTLRVHVVDQRVPQTNNNNVAISLEQGIPVPATAKVTGAVDTAHSPKIKCFVPANYASANCPDTAQALPGLKGVTLNPDGTLTGTPVKGDVGEHQVPLKALGVNGKWSAEFSVEITVSPSTLVFEPGIAPGGTTGQAYEWTFNPATGAEGLDKTYQVIGSDGQPVKGCTMDTSGSKPKLTCTPGALTNGETYTLRVSAGTGDAAVSIDRVFTPAIYPPLKFENYKLLPSAAVGAVYQQQDGSTFRFTASGGSGSYGFGFTAGSGHTQPSSPNSCTGWILKTDQGEDSGLCLERDGRITGTPTVAGTIDLSKLEVTDSAQHKAGLPENAAKALVIHPLLELTTLCKKPTTGADKHDKYVCKGEKNQPVGEDNKLTIATVSGGAWPYSNPRVEGLDAYDAGAGSSTAKLSAGWCDGAPTNNAGGDICLTGTWPKTMVPGSSLNIYVTGAAGRTVTVEAFIPVATDLKFIDNPNGVPAGVTLKQTSDNTRPDNIDQTTWTKVSSKIDNKLPTIGINLGKDAFTGETLTLPSLVTGGVGPYAYRTVPCDNADASGNCALGDTGLFLDKSTGELVGIPKPGTSAAVVVSVTDSDSPAQTKKSNLVFSIADTRKPVVSDTTINAEVGENVNQVISVSDGSGQYKSVQVNGTQPEWLQVELEQNVLTVKGTPLPGHVTSTEGGTFSVTVTDENGNTSEPATIKYTVKDNRVPDLSSLTDSSSPDLTGTEGKSVVGWTDLPKDATGYGPKITSWTVKGLPEGVRFDDATGTLSPNKIASGKSGTYPITITATAENGKTTTIVKNLVVAASDLAVTEANAGTLSKDRKLNEGEPATIATVSGGTGPYDLVSVTGLPSDLSAKHDGNGNIVLTGTIPDEENDYSVTITVKDKDGVERTLTRPLHIGEGLSVAKTIMPTATIGENYGSQCLGVSGGTKPYRISGTPTGVPTGMTIKVENDDVCLSGLPEDRDGSVATVTFTLKDTSDPVGSITVTLKIPVNDEFTASGPTGPTGNLYVGSKIADFTPTTGSGDRCYGLDASGECQRAKFTYSASGLPAGLSINPETGLISGTPTELVSNPTVTVTVASSAPGSDPITKTFSLTVASAFSDSNNHFNVTPSTTVPALDENGTVKTAEPSNQVLPTPKIEKNGKVIATGKYSIDNVQPDSQGNYPLGDTGLALTPDGKLVGTLKPGQPPTAGNNGTFDLGSYDVVLQDDAGGDQIGSQTVAFTVKDTRTPDITVTNATVEVGQAADISIGVAGGSGQIDTVSLSGCSNLSVVKDKIHVPENAFSEGTKVTCQVTVTDHNGLTKTEQFTIKVNDSRQPKFNTNERERYAWQGLDFTNVILDSANLSVKGIPVMTWLVNPSKDSTAAPLKSVKIAGLPDKFKVMSNGTEVTKDNDGAYTCGTPTDCTIVGYAAKDVTGVKDFTLTITADTQNSDRQPTNLTASKSIPLRVFASPLQLNTSTPTGMIRADGGQYTSSVGTVDYRRTITSTTQAGTDLIDNASAWDGTYALDSKAKYEIVKVTAYSLNNTQGSEVSSHGLTLTATPATAAAMPKGDQTKKAQTLTLESTNTGAFPEGTTSLAVELKVTDGHGIERSATVNIPVVQKLEWAGPPFNKLANPVELDTVGVQGAPYPAYYAEAKGGDGSLSTSLAKADDVINNAVEADAKAKFLGGGKYKGIDPVYCDAQGTIKPDTRPKCFPIPGLGGDTSGSSPTNPLSANHQGLFMLSNGKLSGSIPENVTAGTYSAQVLVIDGSGQLIKKTFSITVEQKLTLTIDGNQLPKGKRGICYGSNVKVDLDAGEKCPAVGNGSGVKVGTYGGPDGLTAKCELIPPINGLAVTCTGGTVTISGAPTQTYDGNATVKVTLTDGAGQSVEKTVPLLIETDMIFKGNSTPGTGTDVKVETQTNGTQKIQVDTAADGKKFPNMKLDIEGGVGPYTYYVENSDGSAVSPVPCPAGVTTQTSNGKPIVCYPIGTTGLVLDSEGNVHGTPIPGGSADGKFVVADSDTTSRTKKAAITVNIADKRPPQVYGLTINTTVGATSLSGSTQLVAEDPQNPRVDIGSLPSGQQTAAGKHGFSTGKPTGALGTPGGCSVTGSMPTWLTLDAHGAISLASGVSAVPVDAAGQTLQFCVWYVGPNGVNAPKPAVVSVNVTDKRRVTIDSGNGGTTDAKIGNELAPTSNPATLIGTTIPADMVDNASKPITVTKLNSDGTPCTGTSCKFSLNSPNGANFTDTSIDGLRVTGLNCATSGDPRSCSIAVSGTPTPSAAGDHQLSYQLTLPNGQTQIISHTIHIPPYNLALSVEPMNPAVVGLDYLQISKPVLAQGGSGNYWFQLWDPNNPVTDASDPDNKAKVGDMDLVTTGNQVKLQWTPSAEDLAKASGGNIPVTITVWDKAACNIDPGGMGQNKPGPANCPYKVTKTVNIPLHAAPVTTDITVPEVTEGTSASSSPVYTGSGKAELSGTIAPGNEHLFTFDPNSGVVTLKDTARPGTYTAVIRVTLPGVAIPFYRNVTFTVKEKPVPEPTNPTPIPTTTPEPRPGVAPISPSTGITYPVRDLDTLVVRHGGNDRIDTSLAVLDFFSAKSSTPTEANNLTVAYADYAGKVSLPWSDTAVLVRDDDYPDALVAGPLAANYNAPILMTPTKQVPRRVVDALRTHGFTKVILVGNPGAISAGAASQLQNAGFQVQRLGGQDRYRTAGAVADHLLAARGRDKSDVYLATGVDYPDALSASSAAIKNVGVVLLTPRRTVDGTSQGWMNSAKAAKVVAVGGPAVAAAERSVHLDEKQVGVDRYETAEKVASAYFPPNPGRIAVATGKDFPDATLAASLTARTGSPLVLTRPDTLTKPTTQFLTRNRASVRKVDVVGGKAAVTEKVRGEIYSALR